MKKILLITILFLSLSLYGCSASKGNSVCNAVCVERNYTEGTCQVVGSVATPCEDEFNTTTLRTFDRLCDEYGKDKVSWFEWNIGRGRMTGIGNTCCCG